MEKNSRKRAQRTQKKREKKDHEDKHRKTSRKGAKTQSKEGPAEKVCHFAIWIQKYPWRRCESDKVLGDLCVDAGALAYVVFVDVLEHGIAFAAVYLRGVHAR